LLRTAPSTRGSTPLVPLLALLAAPAAASAEAPDWPLPEPRPPDPPTLTAPDLRLDPVRAASIFQYQHPEGIHRSRAALEIGAGLAYQFAVYVNAPSSSAVSNPRLFSPRDKLFHGAWAFDGNTERTNFGGHPLAGAFFYLTARGNRLGSLEASLAAVAGSTLWEVTEYHEVASINDQVTTPLAGIAIGEPLVQLSAFFEQRDAGTGDRVLAWLLQPFKKGHDLLDRATVARSPAALAWHDFRLRAEAGAARRGGGAIPETGLSFSAELVRGAGYGSAGEGAVTLRDGNAVQVAASVAASPDGLARARIESHAQLLGLYARSLEGEEEPTGQDLLLGLGTGFEAGAWRHDGGGRADWLSIVHVPGVSGTWRSLGGVLPLRLDVRGAVTFGGVRSLVLASQPGAAPPQDLPLVARAYGYYYAWGWTASGRLEASPGALRLGGALRLDDLRGFTARDAEPLPGADPASLGDRRGEVRAWAQWSFGGVAVGTEAARRWAAGRVDAARRSVGATELLLTLELRR
jgi:hypothetical protein